MASTLKSHPDSVNMTDPGNGNTTIHIAAQNGNMEMLQVVMGAGAHVNQQNKGGQTALHMVRTGIGETMLCICVGSGVGIVMLDAQSPAAVLIFDQRHMGPGTDCGTGGACAGVLV